MTETTPIQLAAQRLLSSLDKTPREAWAPTVGMACQATYDLGYAAGYRAGALSPAEEPKPTQNEGE